jgi:hypothetical protein
MEPMRLKTPLFPTLALGLVFLPGCGGPSLEAKTANAIQTLLSTSAEAFLLGGGQTSVSVACNGGGSLSYSPPAAINPGDTSIDLPVNFNNCKLKVCGDELTFEASGQSLLSLTGLDPSQVGNLIGGGAIVGNDEQFLEIEIISSDQGVKGFLTGNVDFAYRMRIIGSTKGLSEISILDSNRGEALEVKGQKIRSDTLKAIADRC